MNIIRFLVTSDFPCITITFTVIFLFKEAVPSIFSMTHHAVVMRDIIMTET
jgi:hypothetical protein